MTANTTAGAKHISGTSMGAQAFGTLTGAQQGSVPMEKAGLVVLAEEIT